MSNVFRRFFKTAHQVWFRSRKRRLRQRIRRQYGTNTDPEIREVFSFLEAHPELELPLGVTPPYEWVKEYFPENLKVAQDETTGLPFVMVNTHRVYFPRGATPPEVQRDASVGQMEQDARSPHCYLGNGFNVDAGDVAVFVGASNGLFCLGLIDRLAKAYLFEPCPDWQEPLRATFMPWSDRVEILPLAVGAKEDDGQVSLDGFFQNRPFPNYIQMDVEGAEGDVLAGARKLLENASKLRLSICTYHRRLDFPKFERLLGDRGYAIHHSPGFYVLGVRMPYFRRGILYAARGVAQPTAFTRNG
jgi:hypothetical protein